MRLFALGCILATALSAQTFRGNIAGMVQDSSGAAIPNAAIKLESPGTGVALYLKSGLGLSGWDSLHLNSGLAASSRENTVLK